MHTIKEMMFQLENMCLKNTDTVMIHSSMKAIGNVENRADGVLDALCGYFHRGLVMMPTLTWNLANQDKPVFDVKNTPSVTGILPQMFRQRENVVRSLHPTHSVAAFGKDAREVTADDRDNPTPCGPTSAWHKLMERDGYILQVGCDLTSCTFIHGIEEWNDVPNRLGDEIEYTMIREDGTSFQMKSRPHLGTPSEQFMLAEKALREEGALTDGQLGDAKVMLLSAKKCNAAVQKLLHENIHLFDDIK